MANVVRKEMYVKADVNNNNNKFWEVTVTDDGTCVTRWGRVGDPGQSKSFTYGSVSAANAFADGKIREKLRDGRNGEIAYRKIDVIGTGFATSSQSSSCASDNRGLAKVAANQIKTNNPLVADLIKRLVEANAHQIMTACGGKITFNDTTGLFSTPLGVITQANIDEANNLLVTISDMIRRRDYGTRMIDLTNDFMMLVPQDIGRQRLDVRAFWSDQSKIQHQKQILDNLQTSLITASSGSHDADKKDEPEQEQKVFDCQLFLIEDGATIDKLRKFYKDTRKDAHVCSHLDVKRAYSVSINTVRSAFESRGSKMTNIFDLWHGTRTCNLLSILKSGLLLPGQTSAQIAGAMFGPGIYGAPSSTKSLNYSYGYWSRGSGYDDNCYMFIIKMAMGKYYIPKHSFSGYPPSGFDSTWAKAGESGVVNDECIVYKTNQVDLQYLLEFSPKGK